MLVSDEVLAEYDAPLGAVLAERRRIEQTTNPDIDLGDHVVLQGGPQAYKIAEHWVIRNRHTGETHHHAVKIETYRRLKTKGGWIHDDEHSITLDDDGGDEILPLATFLGSIRGVDVPTQPGSYLIFPVRGDRVNADSLRQLLETVSAGGKAAVVADVLSTVGDDPETLRALVTRGLENPEASGQAAAALNLARYSTERDEFKALMAANAPERSYQAHLQKNPWMFGSEYSELLPRRVWTRDEEQDFMLRRTVDGYIEAIEIKTTLNGAALFVHDGSRDMYYPQSDLSRAIGQVMQYLEELDADRHRIRSRDDEDTNKIRAKIIIGRDGDQAQQQALRRLNGHLHRIEVLTFDQLVRIAEQVLAALNSVLTPPEEVQA
jgi:hypothetical protein